MSSQCPQGHNAVDLSRTKLSITGKQWLIMACVLGNSTVKDLHKNIHSTYWKLTFMFQKCS